MDNMDYIENEVQYRNHESGHEEQDYQGGSTLPMAQKIAALFYRIKKIRRVQDEITAKSRGYEAKIKKAKENASLYLSKIKALEEENRYYKEIREELTRTEGDKKVYIKQYKYLEKKNARLSTRMRNIAKKLRNEKNITKEMESLDEGQKADTKAAEPEKSNAMLILKKGIEQRDKIIQNLLKNKGLSTR